MIYRKEFAWPDNWRENPRYVVLYRNLRAQYGLERTQRIVAGTDVRAYDDLAKWERFGASA